MSKTKKLSPIAAAVGVSVVAALSSMPVANAASNPFTTTDLGSGYMKVAEGSCGGMKDKDGKHDGKKAKKDGKCGEGKCGGDKKMKKGMNEGSCGDKKGKGKEGSCGDKK